MDQAKRNTRGALGKAGRVLESDEQRKRWVTRGSLGEKGAFLLHCLVPHPVMEGAEQRQRRLSCHAARGE